MLYDPYPMTSYGFQLNNLTTNPNSTVQGTQIASPGSSGSEGTWQEIFSGASVTSDIYWIYIEAQGNVSGSGISHVFDIGIDTAGGTSYSPIIEDVVCGNAPNPIQVGRKDYLFPFFIPAGSSIAMRTMTSTASALLFRFHVFIYGNPSKPLVAPRGAISQTFGVSSSSGTVVTPGNGSWGSYVSLGTASTPLWWWQMGYQIINNTITAEYTYIELSWGDASNKHVIYMNQHAGTTSETTGWVFGTNVLPCSMYCPVPAGATLYARARCINSPDTGYQVGLIGIGG